MEIFMTAGFLIFRYPLLRVLQTPEDTFTGTMSYITVILDILFMGLLQRTGRCCCHYCSAGSQRYSLPFLYHKELP